MTDGIAASVQGGVIPIIQLTDPYAAIDLNTTATSVSGNLNTGGGQFDTFANYVPLSGGTLINNQVAMYPFANQAIAANAIIAQPLTISMMMVCPAGNAGTYGQKQTTMIKLQSSLSQHNNQGGTYSIITPSFIYINCLMTSMRDISSGESAQVQYRWQFDFVQPLITLAAAQQALNGITQQITNGTPPSVTSQAPAAGLSVSTSKSRALLPSIPPQPSAGNLGR